MKIDGAGGERLGDKIERATPIAAPPSLQLEPHLRDQCMNTGLTTGTLVGSPVQPAATHVLIMMVSVAFTALASSECRTAGRAM
jgi:hypothetical protein